MVAVQAWARRVAKIWGTLALVFTALLAVLTMSIHFVILVLGRSPAVEGGVAFSRLSFNWPSVPYALDIFAWDVLFALAALSAAAVFQGSGQARLIRILLVISGLLALAGLSGVWFGDMRLRNIGIVGYAGIFPIAAALIGHLFWRTVPERNDGNRVAATA